MLHCKFRVERNAKVRTTSAGVMTLQPTHNDCLLTTIFFRLAHDLNHINWAFKGLSCNCLQAHQSLMSKMHLCMWSMVDGTCKVFECSQFVF